MLRSVKRCGGFSWRDEQPQGGTWEPRGNMSTSHYFSWQRERKVGWENQPHKDSWTWENSHALEQLGGVRSGDEIWKHDMLCCLDPLGQCPPTNFFLTLSLFSMFDPANNKDFKSSSQRVASIQKQTGPDICPLTQNSLQLILHPLSYHCFQDIRHNDFNLHISMWWYNDEAICIAVPAKTTQMLSSTLLFQGNSISGFLKISRWVYFSTWTCRGHVDTRYQHLVDLTVDLLPFSLSQQIEYNTKHVPSTISFTYLFAGFKHQIRFLIFKSCDIWRNLYSYSKLVRVKYLRDETGLHFHQLWFMAANTEKSWDMLKQGIKMLTKGNQL